MQRMTWPCFKRQEVGNYAFCWAAEWSEKHEPECQKRKDRYTAKALTKEPES